MSYALDHRLMGLALHVARRGDPSPNPHVGAVIAHGDQVVSIGYHARAGGDHAEVMALKKAGDRARGATVYLSLEPCNHHGRTGPCAEALLKAGVARVVVATLDDVPGHGGGVERLRQAGVRVTVGLRGQEADALLAGFRKRIHRGLPWVTLKAAVTLDGRSATATGDSKWITGPEARKHVHRMRAAADAVMVGVGTVLADDPRLTVRDAPGRDPVRVVLDSGLRTPTDAALFDDDAPVWIVCGPEADADRFEALEEAGAELIEVPLALDGRASLESALKALAGREVVHLLVEGGATLHGALLQGGWADEGAIFVAPRILGDPLGIPLARGGPRGQMAQAFSLQNPRQRRFGQDVLFQGTLAGPP